MEAAEERAVEPPTTETKQLLLAVEQDGYAAGRVAASPAVVAVDVTWPEKAT
jgi:hypothetical protein